MRHAWFAVGVAAFGLAAGSALADTSAPSAREVQSAVDSYLAPSTADASLVGGAGSAGYDGGFWIRGGSFLLKINLTIQTRFEYFDWDDRALEPVPGGDLSGFSLPRVTLKLSGDALCDIHYYAELEFGHSGSYDDNRRNAGLVEQTAAGTLASFAGSWPFLWAAEAAAAGGQQVGPFRYPDYGICREAWIEWEACPMAAVRMGLVKTAATRQLMTPPEMQQFVDVSMASAFVGSSMPGYSDRNRDYGVMVHGTLGCDGAWSYLATITNGDGPVHRNVLDGSTSDNLAYSARVNWDVKGHMGYEEGALKQHGCEWVAAVGAWVHTYNDHARENSILKFADRLTWGFDAAAGYGGWSFTAAYNGGTWSNSDMGMNGDGWSWFAQAGYLFPDTAWEVAARYGSHDWEPDTGGVYGASEFAVAVNYYVDGHANKLTADATFVTSNDDGNFFADVYGGYSATQSSDAMLLRFQWQLAL